MKTKKVLLPTDFSDNAWNAITYALEFFKNEVCKFYILHTYTPTFYRLDYMLGGPTYSALPDTGVDVAQAGLEETLININLKFKNPKHKFETLSAFNTLTNEVMELTATKDFDMIVMGTQGATGAKEIFLGTNTVHIIRKSKIPVLAVPAKYNFHGIKSIVFATDYIKSYSEGDLQILFHLLTMHKAKLTVLNVKEDYDLADEQQMNKEMLMRSFKKFKALFVEERGKLMPDAVHEYIAEHENELLVMMKRKHSFFERLLIQQNIDAIGFHTTVPFLAIPETLDTKTTKP
jgi:nucleotide-binding universal stress UspA family protein